MNHFLTLAVATVLGFALPAQAGENVLERVQKTHVLRCGYLPYEPFVVKDINTGKLSGLTVDYLNEVARRKGLTIDWAEEVNFDQVVPALGAGRIDAFCVPCTPNPTFEKVLEFPAPLGSLPYYVYVPQGSTLTPEQLKTARFTTVDGFALSEITRIYFPEAQEASLPQTTSPAEMYDQLRYGKTDAHLNEDISASRYMTNNPGVIRRFSDTPVVAMRMFLLSAKGDAPMRQFMDDTFSVDSPGNLEIMGGLRDRYHVSGASLLLGDQCRPTVNAEGWKVCETSDAGKKQ